MSVPKFYEMNKPILEFLRDEKIHSFSEIKIHVIKYFNLDETSLSELLPSGRQTVFSNRIGWARTHLKKAGLIDSPARATFSISKEGLNVLSDNPLVVDNNYLMRYESFREFLQPSSEISGEKVVLSSQQGETPDDVFEESFRKINKTLGDELLAEVIKLSPVAFERLIIDLLQKMGYGSFENSSRTTAISGDEGIDGIITEDKLGFSSIYIQAKRYNLDSTIGRPDIQSFVGAITGKGGKGLFVTTTKFSKQAIDYAKHHQIVLIDGQRLASLMIEYNFGVTLKKTFEIKVIDTDVFNDYID
jgi:restriction system protein